MTVLLVEDDTMVRPTLAEFFKEAGFGFYEASDAEEALAILDDPSQRIDVLVTDLDLDAGDNGMTLAIKARQLWPKLQVVYKTGNPEILAGRAFSSWERVFYKPFDPNALVATVSVLDGSSFPRRRSDRPSASEAMVPNL